MFQSVFIPSFSAPARFCVAHNDAIGGCDCPTRRPNRALPFQPISDMGFAIMKLRKSGLALRAVLLPTVAAGFLLASGTLFTRAAYAQDAFTVMASRPELSDWLGLVESAGLGGAAGTKTYTVFALTNEGYDNLNALLKGVLTQQGSNRPVNPQLLQTVVRTHVILGLHPPSEFAGKIVTLTTAAGDPIKVDGTTAGMLKLTMRYATAHEVGPPIIADNAIIIPIVDDNAHF
jgi:uncharacterized surface protein with fasciclin (FAS1) repeats